MKKALTAALALVLLLPWTSAAKGPDNAARALERAVSGIQAELEAMDADLKLAADKLATTGLDGKKAKKALGQVWKGNPHVVDVSSINAEGRLVAIVPASFNGFAGKYISGQEQFQRLLSTGKPVLSNVFMSVEGVWAVDLEQPVAAPGGGLLGSASILAQPHAMVRQVLAPLTRETGLEFMVLERTGLVLYDADPSEVGKNTFSDPMFKDYPELIEVAKKICAQDSGRGVYEFRAAEGRGKVRKSIAWDSAGLHGTLWRVCVMETLE
ncbi:MAG: hypothetical protein PHV85_08820 [Desulfovibrionaceae bacterium]|nr:hypothetical protein [Desulfovibrionaceae bacterium]